MTLLIAPILFIATVIYVAYPLLKEGRSVSGSQVTRSQRDRLLEAKENIIMNLKDIEMDYRMGKLSQIDYEHLRADFELQAVEVFRSLESLGKTDRLRKKKAR